MSASENFLKYFLEKQKNMKHFLNSKFHFFSEFIIDIKLSITNNMQTHKIQEKKNKINPPYSVHLRNTLYTLQK